MSFIKQKIVEKKKQNLRKKIRQDLKALSEEQKALEAKIIQTEILRMLENGEMAEFENIAFFVNLKNEVDLISVIKKCMEKGKNCYLPRVLGMGEMEFFLLENQKSLEEQLEKGSFGILEPKLSLKKLKADEILVFIPGLAFDKKLNRMGKGKGFYDIYFENHEFSKIKKCGVCFSCQMKNRIPSLKHDIKMDYVISGK